MHNGSKFTGNNWYRLKGWSSRYSFELIKWIFGYWKLWTDLLEDNLYHKRAIWKEVEVFLYSEMGLGSNGNTVKKSYEIT